MAQPCTIQCRAHYVLYIHNIEVKYAAVLRTILFIVEHEMCSMIHQYVAMQHNIYHRA